MAQDRDALTQQIATTRQELDTYLSRLPARARWSGWRRMWVFVAPFVPNVVLATVGERRLSQL